MKTMNNYVSYIFGVRDQAHLYHFQTASYAEHIALDDFYTGLLDSFDELVEIYQANNERIQIQKQCKPLENYVDTDTVIALLQEYVGYTTDMKDVCKGDDMQGILDDMIALGNKTIYLLSLS